MELKDVRCASVYGKKILGLLMILPEGVKWVKRLEYFYVVNRRSYREWRLYLRHEAQKHG